MRRCGVRTHMRRTRSGRRVPVVRHNRNLRTISSPRFSRSRLPVQVSVIVPSTKKDKSITDKEYEKRIKDEQKWFNDRFGGSTTIEETGSYNMGGKVIKEKGVIVESSMSVKTYEKKKHIIEKHFRTKRNKWKQDTVLIKVEGQTFLIPKKSYINNDKKQNNRILVS